MGLIMCVIIQGLIAAFVGESVSELVQMFPAPNALYVYVAEFVDEDLGWIASVAHWYVEHASPSSWLRLTGH